MGGKQRLAKEMAVDGLAVFAQGGALVQTSAAEVKRERELTVGRFALHAVSARRARQVGENHMVARPDLGHVLAPLVHHAGSLMPLAPPAAERDRTDRGRRSQCDQPYANDAHPGLHPRAALPFRAPQQRKDHTFLPDDGSTDFHDLFLSYFFLLDEA